jgi:uncharacterized membrane protein YkoI
MKVINSTKIALITLGLSAALAASGLTKEHKEKEEGDEQKVEMNALPASVQSTIQAKAKGGSVTELEKETKNGAVVYEAKVKASDGKMTKIKVSADGKLLKVKECGNKDKEEEGEKD